MEPYSWSHILLLDAKIVKGLIDVIDWRGKIKRIRRNWALLLARDFKTHDIIAFRLANGETTAAYTQLIKEVRKCGYVIWVVISDDCPAIGSLFEIKQIRKPIKGNRPYPRPAFPKRSKKLRRTKKGILHGIPHQLCTIHFKRGLERILKPRRTKIIGNKFLFEDCKKLLFVKTYKQAKKVLARIIIKAAKGNYASKTQTEAISSLLKNFGKLTCHLRIKEGRLKLPDGKTKTIPSTTNPLENNISYLEARLKTMKRFKSRKSALNTLRLIILNFRFKPLKEAKNKKQRGKSPLDLSIKQKLNFDWLKFSQKTTA